MRHYRGFTLLEMLTTLVVIGVLLGLAGPGLLATVARNQRVAAVNNLVGSLQYARSEAHKLGVESVLCKSRDLYHCETVSEAWEHGWIVFADYTPDTPRQVQGEDKILVVRHHQPGVLIRANRPAFALRPHYRRSSNGTLIVCPASQHAAPKAIIVSVTGRPRLSARLPDGQPIVCPEPS